MLAQLRPGSRGHALGVVPLLSAGEELPLRTASLDLVTAFNCVHHFDLGRFLTAVARVLAPGGRLQPGGARRSGRPGEPGDQGSGPPDQRRARQPGCPEASRRPPGDRLLTDGMRLGARRHHVQRTSGRRRNTTSPGPDAGVRGSRTRPPALTWSSTRPARIR